jgi:outer membrane protein
MKYIVSKIPILFILFLFGHPRFADGQNNSVPVLFIPHDSLDLQEVVKQVITTYPSILKAQEAIQSAEAGIGLAHSGYFPTINADAGYTRLGPVSELSIPQMGTFQIYPQNNYNASVSVYQTIYDFSQTARNIKLEESSKEISEKNVELVKQKLTLITCVSYYSLVYLQEALKIRNIQLETLKEHLDFVTRKMETGSATKYEILSTQVRISIAENQKVDVETAIKTQQAILNSLMGLPVVTKLNVKSTFTLEQPKISFDSLFPYAIDHRYEMVLADLREKHSELHLRSVRAQNNPVLSAFLTGGWKNGYIPDLTVFTGNYAAGVGVHVPVFDATRQKNNIKMANAAINMSKQETAQTSREISTEVFQNEANLKASLQKIKQSELQVQQSQEALALAKVSFSSGSITNLDLLDAETAASESKVSLLKARIDYVIDVVRLNISIGKSFD